MAWSIVGVGTVAETTTTSLTLTEPASVAAGDLLVMCIAGRGYASGSTWCGTPTGWISVQRTGQANTATNTSALANGAMFYCIRGASAPSYAVTLSGTASVARGLVVAYRGNLQVASLDVSGTVATATNTTAVSVTGITTTTADDLLVSMTAGGQEAAWSAFKSANAPSTASGATNTSSAPSTTTWTERVDSITTSGADTSIAVFDAVKTATGATGNYTATASLGAGHVVINAAFKIARSTANAWNGADASSAYLTLTNNDQTIASGSNITAGIRSTRKNLNGSSGKYYVEFELAAGGGSTTSFYGIMSASAALTGTGAGGFHLFGTGNIYVDGVNQGISVGTFSPGHVAAIAWDAGAELAWFRNGSGAAGWNNSGTANPATGVGGISVSFAASVDHAAWFQAEVSGESVNLYTTDGDFRLFKPSGFLSWMGEGPVSVSVNATTNVITVSVGDEFVPQSISVDAATNLLTVTQGTATVALPAAVNVTGQSVQAKTGALGPEQVGYPTLTPVDAYNYTSEMGSTVRFASAGQITGIKYWRYSLEDVNGARNVRLWTPAGVQLAVATGPNDTGMVGWVTVSFPTPYEVSGGVDYVVSANMLNYYLSKTPFSFPVVNGDVTISSNSYTGTLNAYPSTPYVDCLFIDVVFRSLSGPAVTVIAQAGVSVNVTGQVIYALDPVTVVVAIPIRTGWNPADTTAKITLSSSDRTATAVSGSYNEVTQSTEGHASGVWYAEITVDVLGSSFVGIGALTTDYSGLSFAGTAGFMYLSNGDVLNQSATTIDNIGTFAAGDVISVSIDADTGKVWFRKNAGNWNNGGVGYTYTAGPALYLTALLPTNTAKVTLNTGALPFSYTVPPTYLDWFEYPPMNVSVTGLQVTASMGDETILLPVAINVWGVSVVAGSVGLGVGQSAIALTPPVNGYSTTELGSKIRFSKAGRVTNIRYWRDPLATGMARTTRLWDVNTQTQLTATSGADDGSITGWVTGDPINWNVVAGVDYMASVGSPDYYPYLADPPYPLVNGHVTVLGGAWSGGSGIGAYPATDLTSPPLCLFVDVIFRENSAEETVNTGVSLTAATNLLTTTVGNESVTIPVSVNATTNLISTTTGTVTLPRLVPVTTNLITVSLGDEVVRLPKIVNAATNLITVSDNVATVITRTDVSTNLTGQSAIIVFGQEGAGSTPRGDAWNWMTASPIGMPLTNDDMTAGG